MDYISAITLRMNKRVVYEPLGLIRIIQLPMAILAFATTSGYSAALRYKVSCPGGTKALETSWGYPFRFSDSYVLEDPCGSTLVSKSLFASGLNYASSAEFFVFTGVLTFLFCLFSLFVYLFLWSKYTGDFRAAYIDLGATAGLALFWFCGSCAWATDVTSLKRETSVETIRDNLSKVSAACKTASKCDFSSTWDYAGLNVSLIAGFVCFGLFAANLWFVYKETAIFKAKSAPPPPLPTGPVETPQMVTTAGPV